MIRIFQPLRHLTLFISIGVLFAGCETGYYGPQRVGQTAVQRAMLNCAMTIGASSGIGALLARADDRVKGAMIGAGVGAAACAVMIDVASQQDRARVAEAERAAVSAGRTQTKTIRTNTGKTAQIQTRVAAAPVPKSVQPPMSRPQQEVASVGAPQFTACRTSTVSVSVDGGSSTVPDQLWCRTATGDWQPYAG